MDKKIRHIIAIILIIIILAIISSFLIHYHPQPSETYIIDSENLIEDGSFEKFNQTVGDCCKTNPNMSKVYASKSPDAYIGKYSLNLTSEYQCACISKPLMNFNSSQIYLLSFYYKGQNPKYCNFDMGNKICSPLEYVNKSNNWQSYRKILYYQNNSESPFIFLYADSTGQLSTNLYDNLQVNKLIQYKEQTYHKNTTYIIKTKSENIVKNAEKISEDDKGQAYYLVMGKPDITLKFPYTELIMIIILTAIVARLLFKKQVIEAVEKVEEVVMEDVIKPIEQKVEEIQNKIEEKKEEKSDKQEQKEANITDPYRRNLWYSEMYKKKLRRR